MTGFSSDLFAGERFAVVGLGLNGRAAAGVLEKAIRMSHDRLCTVTRTVELPTPVGARLHGVSLLHQASSPA